LKLAGFSLLEVLVALLIFSLLFFSYVTLSARVSEKENRLYFQTVAQNRLQDLFEYVHAYSASGSDQYLMQWNQRNDVLFPHYKIHVQSSMNPQVTLCWFYHKEVCVKESL
jgi:prepilin-type N-terminal cleavage/methylation domain-containing protein